MGGGLQPEDPLKYDTEHSLLGNNASVLRRIGPILQTAQLTMFVSLRAQSFGLDLGLYRDILLLLQLLDAELPNMVEGDSLQIGTRDVRQDWGITSV